MEKLKYIEATIEQSASKENEPPRFRILANAGSRMSFLDSDVVVNLAGEVQQKDARAIPILYGHDWDQQLGHATVVSVDENGIVLEGVVSVPSERAREWVESAKAGFPWNASLGFVIEEGTEVGEDEEIEVNGRVEKGALIVANKIQVWECSVVTFGADGNTAADVSAKQTVKASKEKESKMENEDKKPDVNAQTPEPTPTPSPSVEELRAARVAENERIDAIEKLAKELGVRDFVNAAITEGWTPDRFELETLRKSRANVPSATAAKPGDPNKIAVAAMLRACGAKLDEKKYTAAELEAADKLKSQDLRGIFEAATGFKPTESQRQDGKEWVQAASVSTYGLPGVLSTTANALLLNALGVYERRWAPLFKTTSVNDFRKVERWRIDSDFEFAELAPGQEMEHGTQSESGWEIQVKNYGKQYVLAWESMINGEALGVFSDIMQQIAYGAESKLNRVCWSLVMNPGNASDGTAFYHANHGSLLTGKALTLQNLSAAITAFVSRKKANGTPIGIEPRYLLVPPTLLTTARNILNASWVDATATSLPGVDYNPLRNIVDIVSAPQLEYTEFTNNSNSTWYLFAEPNALASFEIAFLRGQQSPVLRSSELEIGRLGLAIDGHIAFGVLAEDWRAALKVTA